MAVEAAFGDTRFCALAADELDKIDIEISVLTPLRRIGTPSEIEIGKHGLLVRKGFASGLLLPQVATEHNLDREQFLEWTCRKAGLPEEAWKSKNTDVYVFSADVLPELWTLGHSDSQTQRRQGRTCPLEVFKWPGYSI